MHLLQLTPSQLPVFRILNGALAMLISLFKAFRISQSLRSVTATVRLCMEQDYA